MTPVSPEATSACRSPTPSAVVELRCDELVVAVALDVPEDAERDDPVRRLGDARERERGGEVGLVVDDARVAGRLPCFR